MMKSGLKQQTVFNFIILCPLFLLSSLLLSRLYEGHKQDFAAYWQAGHMILSGQDVYDSAEWIAVREAEGTALHSEPTFQYPLPLAVLFAPLALIPVHYAHILWMFFAQVAILTSIIALLSFYPNRSGYLELLAIAGIFLYRPTFTVVYSGQILTLLLILLVLSIRLFHAERWFLGGLLLSSLSLKPSVGLPVLFLSGLWLLSRKQWKGIWGLLVGGFGLVLIGALVNYRWIIDYISIGGNSFYKYFGINPTLWGAVDKIFKADSLSFTVGLVCTVAILGVEAYLFWRSKSNIDAFSAFASIVPAALFVTPYLWHHDQILLIIPIMFLLTSISVNYGMSKAALFIIGIVALALAMVAIAYRVGHDVWSSLNSFIVWLLALYFMARKNALFSE